MLSNNSAFNLIFEGNSKAHYTWKPGEYTAVPRGITEDDVARHLRGEEPGLLSVPILQNGCCHFAAGDCDRHFDADVAVDFVAVAQRITELSLPLILTRSKSEKSCHIWLFFLEKDGCPCTTARNLIEHYMKLLGIGGKIEIFPKQETLKQDEDGVTQKGSGINLPHFGESRLAYGRAGEILDLEGFITLAQERRSYGVVLADRDLAGGSSGRRAVSEEKSDRPFAVDAIRKIHLDNLKGLLASNTAGHWNDTLNTTAFFAGRAFAAKALDGSEQDIKTAIRAAAKAISSYNERQMESTLKSGWQSGITQPLKVLEIAKVHLVKRPDMPESVLDGQLGRWCRERLPEFPIAYSWPSILTAASAVVEPHPKNRVNLFTCLIGEIHTGKTTAQDHANELFRVKELGRLCELKAGSAEGLLENIGDRQGAPVLWYPEELSHLLEKSQIEHSSFPFVLNSVFYKDTNELVVARRKQVKFFARMSLAGGVVEDNFGDSFGSSTTAGMYDRFLFGVCPSDFNYSWSPMKGLPLFKLNDVAGETLFEAGKGKEAALRIVTPAIDPDVWAARDQIRKGENIEPRVLEICIRCALICAAWDRKAVLRASDLGPCFELARYQTRVRALLKPNPGRTIEGIVAVKILNYVKAKTDGEKWIPWRDIYRATHIRDFGPSIADRAVTAMVFAGDLRVSESKPEAGGRVTKYYRLGLDE